MPGEKSNSARNATLVAAGILLSRVVGLLRQMLFARAFGNGIEAAAFSAASRIPNFLQNLLGEGVLSASFIPVYAGLRSSQNDKEANEVASAVFGLLSVAVAVLVALGLIAAPFLVHLLAPGFSAPTAELTVSLVRILFPGTGVLVLSAWCLGILNSHKKFFLSYAAPVIWNACIIATLLVFRSSDGKELNDLVVKVAWATAIGGALQFLLQLPTVLKLLENFKPIPSVKSPSVLRVLRGFLPAVTSRGVVQISSYVDAAFASLISERAVSALTYAQTISLLPVSLFGMAVAAAELPDMSADATKSQELRAAAIRERIDAGQRRMAFFVVPSMFAFLFLGDLIAQVLLQSGRFTSTESRYCWYILMGSAIALLAQTSGRLLSSALFALGDTKRPMRIAMIRVSIGIVLGYCAITYLPDLLGVPKHLGVVFITLTTGFTSWIENQLLRRTLAKEIGPVPPLGAALPKLFIAALISSLVAIAVKAMLVQRYGADPLVTAEWGGWLLPPPMIPPEFGFLWLSPTRLTAGGLLGIFGISYILLTFLLNVPQARALVARISKNRRKV